MSSLFHARQQMRSTLAVLAISCLIAGLGSSETLLIADKTGDVLLYFDTKELRVTRSVEVGGNPHEVAVTPDGRIAFTSNSRSNTVSVVDVKNGEEMTRLQSPLFRYPHGMAIVPGGETLFLTSEQKRLLISIDVASLEVGEGIATHMDGTHMVVLSPDGRRAYLTNRESGTVTTLELDNPASMKHSEAGRGAEGIALSPDGRWFLAANRHDNDLYIFDAATLSLEAEVEVGAGPVRVACSPDGKWALVTHRGSHQVHVVDLEARTVETRLPVGREPGGVVFSSDGKKAFVANTGEGTLSVVDMQSFEVLSTHDAGDGPDGVAVLPQVSIHE